MKSFSKFLILLGALSFGCPSPAPSSDESGATATSTTVQQEASSAPRTGLPTGVAGAPVINSYSFAQPDPKKMGAVPQSANPPSSWTQPVWFIDPVNGNDTTHTGITSGSALKTWRGLMNRWQCFPVGEVGCPVLNQLTVVTFLTDQPDNTDPVLFQGVMGEGGSFFLTGTLTQVTWGSATLGAVTAKNRATGVLLQANLGQAVTPAVGLLLKNTTHSGISWIDSAATNVATLTQPELPIPAPPVTPPQFGTEVNTYVITDAFTIQKPSKVYVQVFEPIAISGDNSFHSIFSWIEHVWVPDPHGPGGSPSQLNSNVFVYESRFDTFVYSAGNMNESTPVISNSWMNGTGQFSTQLLEAGAFNTQAAYNIYLNGSFIDNDAILHGNVFVNEPLNPSQPGTYFTHVYLDGTVGIGGSMIVQTDVWGVYTLNVTPGIGSGFLGFTTSATASFLHTPTLKIGGATTAFSVTAAQPAVWNNAVTINVTNLDAAAGTTGFGGAAINPRTGGRIALVP